MIKLCNKQRTSHDPTALDEAFARVKLRSQTFLWTSFNWLNYKTSIHCPLHKNHKIYAHVLLVGNPTN